VATLTYDYGHSAATLGPLSPEHDPGDYDLCLDHSRNLQVPSGWQLHRVAAPVVTAGAEPAWLANLADEVRRIGWRDDPGRAASEPDPGGVVELAHRRHLRVIADIP